MRVRLGHSLHDSAPRACAAGVRATEATNRDRTVRATCLRRRSSRQRDSQRDRRVALVRRRPEVDDADRLHACRLYRGRTPGRAPAPARSRGRNSSRRLRQAAMFDASCCLSSALKPNESWSGFRSCFSSSAATRARCVANTSRSSRDSRSPRSASRRLRKLGQLPGARFELGPQLPYVAGGGREQLPADDLAGRSRVAAAERALQQVHRPHLRGACVRGGEARCVRCARSTER